LAEKLDARSTGTSGTAELLRDPREIAGQCARPALSGGAKSTAGRFGSGRAPVDSFAVQFLDRKVLKDLKFVTYTFENNPQGKFMLAILLGQSKYYVDALSESPFENVMDE